jgi:hypothetical protein
MNRSTSIPSGRAPALAALLALGSLAACQRGAVVDDDSGGAALMRNLETCAGIEVHVAPGPLELAARRAVALASARHPQDYALVPLEHPSSIAATAGDAHPTPHDDTHRTEPGDVHRARIVVGTPAEPVVRALVERTGLAVADDLGDPAFRWQDLIFDGRHDGLIATFEDPARPGLPLTLYVANDASAIGSYLGELDAGWKPWIRVFSAGVPCLSGPLERSGRVIATRLDRLFDRRRSVLAQFQPLPANELGLYGRASPELAPQAIAAYLRTASRARARVAAWASAGAPAPATALFLHAKTETFAALAARDELATWNPLEDSVHALCAPDMPNDGGAALARASACAWLGVPSEPWLADGAAVDAAGTWWSRSLDRWVAWLHLAGIAPPLERILEPDARERLSPHIVVPMRAAFFRFLLDTRGDAFVRALWSGASHLALDAEIARAFEAYCSALDARDRAVFDALRARRASVDAPFLKGVGLEAPDSDPRRGFGSQLCARSLRDAQDLGANAVSLTAFFVDERDPPRFPGGFAERNFGSEGGDLGLFDALASAEHRGLATLLTPHLITAPGGVWTGAWVRSTKASWEEFFASYERFAVHCALLCELAGADYLSLGAHIPDVARGTAEGRRAQASEVEAKKAGWARVIRSARAAFSGRLTYSATSVQEADRIAFWPELDAIGYECFGRLRAAEREGVAGAREELSQRIDADLQALAKIAARAGKPLILTQVGFDSGARLPGVPRAGPGSADAESQADAYRALSAVLFAPDAREHVRGVFVWRWSTDPDDRGIGSRDFVFRHGPAEFVVQRMFGEL